MVPFPQQRIYRIKIQPADSAVKMLAENPFNPLPWPISPERRRPVVGLTHFFNEEMMMPFWIRHHSKMFDHVILIDYHSTDKSVEIARREAPSTWTIVTSRNNEFSARAIDAEVESYESTYPDAWKVTLTITEFIAHANLRTALQALEKTNPDLACLRFHAFSMVGNDSVPLMKSVQLLQQRSQFMCAKKNCGITSYSRYMHRLDKVVYGLGRHGISQPAVRCEYISKGFISKFLFTPWPECIPRKLQIRVPMQEFSQGFGFQHNLTPERLDAYRNGALLSFRPDFHDVIVDEETYSPEVPEAQHIWYEAVQGTLHWPTQPDVSVNLLLYPGTAN